jgi:DNA invertase Pin-like site-specific DNA recombinase
MSAQTDETTRTYLAEEYLSGRLADGGGRTDRALLYLRVSHGDSALSGLSVSEQERACREACRRAGVKVVGVYKDEGRSAYRDSEERPGFRAMIDAATKSFGTCEPVTLIVVNDLSRFSRDEAVNFKYKRTLLPQYGIRVVAACDGLQQNDLEPFRETIDRQESKDNARRTMRGMVANAREGHVTAGKTPWGYRAQKTPIGRDSHGKDLTRTSWVPDPERQEDVNRLFGLLAEGVGIHNVAAVMNQEGRPSPSGGLWVRATVYDLARKVYVYEGTYLFNVAETKPWQHEQHTRNRRILKDPRVWVRTCHAYPAMIDSDTAGRVRARFPLQNDSPELYERQQRKIADELRPKGERRGGHTRPADGINNKSRNSRWVLTGLALCGDCGHNLVGHRHTQRKKRGVWNYYQCGQYQRTHGSACRSYYIPAERFERAVFEGVAERLATDFGRREVRRHIEEVVGALRRDADQHIGALEREATARDHRRRAVLGEALAGGFDRQTCQEMIDDLRREAADLRGKARGYQIILARANGIEEEVQALLSSTGRLLRTWELLEPAERRARLSEVVSAVVVDVPPVGGDNTVKRVTNAAVSFRGLLQDTQQTRVQIKTALAAKAEVPELTHLRALGAGGAGSPTEWLPARGDIWLVNLELAPPIAVGW